MYRLDANDRLSLLAGVGFDASIWEIWAALQGGASLHIPDEEVRLQPVALQKWLLEEEITYSFVPTPLMEQLLSLTWTERGALRAFLTGGDQLHQTPPASFPVPVVNHYGPTENAVVATALRMNPGEDWGDLPPIGRAIDQVELYVLNAHQQLLPAGMKGELYIGGQSLARGYRQQSEETAKQFIDHPLLGRIYRTRDQVRLRHDGQFEFLGRLDQQVKLRGYRIELGEIEACLTQMDGIQEAVVDLREDQLIAYAVVDGAFQTDWQKELRKRLPAYMIPVHLVTLDAIPLTANGKIDRRALPQPKLERQDFVAPRTPMERKIAEVWSDLLSVSKIGIHDHFFLLGGHSLLATQAITRLNELFRLSMPIRYLFESPTIAQLVERIKKELLSSISSR
jgi:acyl-coenzyme A synthetase/AMP-(fatty) acid ligase